MDEALRRVARATDGRRGAPGLLPECHRTPIETRCPTSAEAIGWPALSRPGALATLSPGLSKQIPELVFGSLQSCSLCGRELLARPIHIESEHGHGRAKGIGLVATTTLSRTLQRSSNSPRILLSEDTRLEIQGITGLGHTLRPPLAVRRSHLMSDRAVQRTWRSAARPTCRRDADTTWEAIESCEAWFRTKWEADPIVRIKRVRSAAAQRIGVNRLAAALTGDDSVTPICRQGLPKVN